MGQCHCIQLLRYLSELYTTTLIAQMTRALEVVTQGSLLTSGPFNKVNQREFSSLSIHQEIES